MIKKIRLISLTLGSGIILFIMLCIGTFNSDKPHYEINLSFSNDHKTIKMPTGFILGVSILIGLISGGSASAITLKEED